MSSASFSEISRALRDTAQHLALNVAHGEALVARLDSPSVDHAFCELRSRAGLVGQAYELIKSLEDNEIEVRALAARKSINPERSVRRRMQSGIRRCMSGLSFGRHCAS